MHTLLDLHGWHRAAELRVPQNMPLLFLPPYSPELNPMEHLWEEIREKQFPNLIFDSMEAVTDRLVQALVWLESHPKLTASITGFDWIVSIRLNAT